MLFRSADKSVSLSEEKRRREKEETAARFAARNRQRPASAKPSERVYEINLRNAMLPGLPRAEIRTNAPALTDTSPLSSEDDLVGPGNGHGGSSGTDLILAEARRILQDYLSLLR